MILAIFKINEPLALQKVVSGLDDLFWHDIKGLDMQGDLYEHMEAGTGFRSLTNPLPDVNIL